MNSGLFLVCGSPASPFAASQRLRFDGVQSKISLSNDALNSPRCEQIGFFEASQQRSKKFGMPNFFSMSSGGKSGKVPFNVNSKTST
jgi:hypothetical protein